MNGSCPFSAKADPIIEDMLNAYWPLFEGGLKRRGTAIEFLKDKIDEIHKHYRNKGLNNLRSMPDIEYSILRCNCCHQEGQIEIPSPYGRA
jgi:hypothetical protein